MRLFSSFILALIFLVQVEAEYPIRSPQIGEERPNWWLDCWYGHCIVVEGTISVNEEPSSDLLLGHSSKFRQSEYLSLQDIVIHDVLYAAPGIKDLSGTLGKAWRASHVGNLGTMPIYVHVIASQSDGSSSFLVGSGTLQPSTVSKGFYVINFLPFSGDTDFFYTSCIPNDKIEEAAKIFTYRQKFDHTTKKAE